MSYTRSTCQEKWISLNGVYLFSWKKSAICWFISQTDT